jgi:hypothetical protein
MQTYFGSEWKEQIRGNGGVIRFLFREMKALVQNVYSAVHTIDLRIRQKQRWPAVVYCINKSVIRSSNEQTTSNNDNTDLKINNGELR